MEVAYNQTTADYYNAYKHISRRLSNSTKWRYLATFSGVACGFLVALGAASISKYYQKYDFLVNEELSSGLTAIAVGIAILIVGLKIYNVKVRSLIFDENGPYLSPQKYCIEKEYLLHYLGDNQHRYLWKYVREVEKTPSYIYVFIDRGAALYIPRHGFVSDGDYDSFYEALSSHAQKNR